MEREARQQLLGDLGGRPTLGRMAADAGPVDSDEGELVGDEGAVGGDEGDDGKDAEGGFDDALASATDFGT